MDLNKNEIKQNAIRIAKGSMIAILITLIILFIFSIILTYTEIQENCITPVIIIITAISILIGSSSSTLKIKKNGLINGLIVGLIYFLVIYILSSVMGTGFAFNINSTIMLISILVSGMIGGVIGVNL